MNKPIKALVLFSGGLDSMLAAKLLLRQGIETTGLCFKSNFFNAKKAVAAADKIGIELKICDIEKDILKLVMNPPSGYGKNMNPCLDCHSLMIRKAGEIARKEGFAFVATGEVLGQRPFSQNKEALKRVIGLSGVEVLRPLSAKLLPETNIEKNKLVVRGRLMGIKGRSREQQFELAEKFNIKNYPTPAGGCLLTDPEFSERLLKLLDYWPKCGGVDAELLKYGRIFWLNGQNGQKILLVIGRHKRDNENLEKLVQKGDIVLQLEEINGPTSLLKNLGRFDNISNLAVQIPDKLKMSELHLNEEKSSEQIIRAAAILTGYYAVKTRGKNVIIKIDHIS